MTRSKGIGGAALAMGLGGIATLGFLYLMRKSGQSKPVAPNLIVPPPVLPPPTPIQPTFVVDPAILTVPGGQTMTSVPPAGPVTSPPRLLIGVPFRAGQVYENHNAAEVCKLRPTKHPSGRRRGRGQSLGDWLANVAYWETYPEGPPILSATDASHHPYRAAWVRLRRAVDICLGGKPETAKPGPKPSAGPRPPSKPKPTPAPEPSTAAIFGPPYKTGRANEVHNIKLACKLRPKAHPNGYRRKQSQKLADWLANIVYWETYPQAPLKLNTSEAHRPFRVAWVRLRKGVGIRLAAEAAAKPSPSTKPTTPKPEPKPEPELKPEPKEPKPEPSPEKVPSEKPTKTGAGKEARNASMVVVVPPSSWKGREREPNQKQADWLTNVAFWQSYPEAPLKLDLKNKGHETLVTAWVRIHSYVTRGLKLLPKLGDVPMLPSGLQNDVARKNWHRWALAMAFRSPARTVEMLRKIFKTGWEHVFKDDAGKAWRKHWEGKRVAGQKVTLEGLIGEAGQWLGLPGRTYTGAMEALEAWPKTLTKAFAAVNDTMEIKG